MEDIETALKIIAISKDLSRYAKEMEVFVKSEELPKSELAYYKAKEIACETLRAEDKTVGETEMMIKGRIGDEMFRMRTAEIKMQFFRDKTRSLEKQLSAYQSVNKKFSMI